jgi:hypothetical protein
LVRKVPDRDRQEKIIANAVVSPVIRQNDNLVKQAVETAIRPPAPPRPPAARSGSKAIGLERGNEAIDILKRIWPSDEQYVRGHQVVADYIRHTMKLVVPPHQPEGDFEDVSSEENCKRWTTLLQAVLKVEKLAAAMAEDGILTADRMKDADDQSTAYLLGDMIGAVSALQLVVDVACEAGGPL